MKNQKKKLQIIKRTLLFSLLALFAVSCEDTLEVVEYGKIRGEVRDALTNAPIQGVAISTNPASSSVATDENGIFLLEDVPIGEVAVSAKKLEYKSYTVTVKVEPATETTTIIMMEKTDGYGLPSGNFIKSNPASGTIGFLVNDTVSWQFIPDRETDSIKYTVKLFESPDTDPVLSFENITDTFAVLNGMDYYETYYWQVSAIVNDSAIANSELWSFTTEKYPDNPILFARRVNNNYDIYTVDTSGNILSKITESESNIDWFPRVNPVTGKVAFVSNRHFNEQIFIMDNQGKDVYKVTNLPITGNYNAGTGFCWSPDGSMLLYPHYNKLYSVHADGTGLNLIATAPEGRHFTSCDWSNYTGKIVVQTTGNNPFDNEIYLLNEDGSEMTLFIDNLPGVIQNPAFSIDGLKVMFTQDMAGLDSWDGRQLDTHILLKAINDTIITDLSEDKSDGTIDLMPRFSPDGAYVIFVNTSNVQGSRHDIMILDLVSGTRNLIIEDASMPEWRKTGIRKK